MKPATFLLLALGLGTAGCSTDQLARAVYYSIRVGNPAVDQSMPGSQFRSTGIPYDQYQQERRGDPSR